MPHSGPWSPVLILRALILRAGQVELQVENTGFRVVSVGV